MTEPDRAEAMARRLDRTARRLGLSTEGRALILDAFRGAMGPRRSRITEDHHPDYLHPARTALILMDDTREADPVTLTAALLAESRDPGLALPSDEAEALNPEAAALARAVPGGPGNEERVEALLALPTRALRVSAAERLDHARHLHLRDPGEWAAWHRYTGEAYAPVVARVDDTLAGRLRWWYDMFAGRFLGS